MGDTSVVTKAAFSCVADGCLAGTSVDLRRQVVEAVDGARRQHQIRARGGAAPRQRGTQRGPDPTDDDHLAVE